VYNISNLAKLKHLDENASDAPTTQPVAPSPSLFILLKDPTVSGQLQFCQMASDPLVAD
jgi:hypothetical protein